MSRRLSTSRSRPVGLAPTDQTYEIECSCGETLFGHREIQAQTVSCPQCNKAVFVLPADCYAGPSRERRTSASSPNAPSGGLVDKLNRLAFWSKLRNSRRSVVQKVREMGRWVKRRLQRRP